MLLIFCYSECGKVGKNYYGTITITVQGDSECHCEDLCTHDTDCEFWVYVKNDKTCSLGVDKTKTTNTKGVISGPRHGGI